MKIYSGRREPGSVEVTVWEGTNVKKLPLCLKIRNHSPTGFEWGYGGSGPAQLALAILNDCLRDTDLALELYQDFKWQVVAAFKKEQWEISEGEIKNWVDVKRNAEIRQGNP